MLVKVTQAHISAGMRRLCDACPIALAINDALTSNGIKDEIAIVYRQHVDIVDRNDMRLLRNYNLGQQERNFITAFDGVASISSDTAIAWSAPFEFELA